MPPPLFDVRPQVGRERTDVRDVEAMKFTEVILTRSDADARTVAGHDATRQFRVAAQLCQSVT